jgi:shikimate kinase
MTVTNDAWHLALLGLPGAGKSTVARHVGELLHRPVVDFDEQIERRAGATIAQIFEAHGEAHFRDLEREVTQELVTAPASVLAPGGGWSTRSSVVGLIRPRTLLVWLQVSPRAALERMGTLIVSRPLLMKGDSGQILADLLADRQQFYQQADLVVDTELVDAQQVAAEVVRLASDWRGRVG